MTTSTIESFFHDIGPTIVDVVEKAGQATIVKDKGESSNYATHLDIAVEDYIVARLTHAFPDDAILAEENHSDTQPTSGRLWIIDPICGTSNLGKGIATFCTNIALAEDGRVVASCVIDHCRKEYIWSTGDGEVYVGNTLYKAPSNKAGRKIDVDFGSIRSVDNHVQKRHNAFLLRLVEETSYSIMSFNSSLGFAYTAIGKIDGFVNVFNHPWDIAAASFLLQQSGGIITGLDGSPWTLDTVGAIGARTAPAHKELLDLFMRS